MSFNGSIGLLILVVELIFMMLALFGGLTVPFAVWAIWLAVGIVVCAIERRGG